jgi:D-beta-D-heptose 7-phosphate kinase/D-beta-D-heptose 1-phosphate adenosyltransferase
MNPAPKIAVFGDACLDIFYYGECSRLCAEAPVPILTPTLQETNPGMAANVAENLRALGAEVHLVSNPPSSVQKSRFIDAHSNHMILRVDSEQPLQPCDLGDVAAAVWDCNCAIVSDYNKGFISEKTAAFIAKRFPISFLDTKKPLGDWTKDFTFIKINQNEYQRTKETITHEIVSKLIATLGKDGCRFQETVYPPPTVFNSFNPCGAGDTFLAALAIKYLKEREILSAIQFALLCASEVVQYRGVSVPKGVSHEFPICPCPNRPQEVG